MPLRLSLGKPITGAPAAKVKINPFVMVAITEANLRPRLFTQPRQRLCISVAANSPKIVCAVTVRIHPYDCSSAGGSGNKARMVWFESPTPPKFDLL
jgi:hypothetical protein